ncbi:DUF1405 domain-containing protein [Halalkalibacillus halophilus]|uniref:DUF1405 domain-containing protein n=1 Tax=Halalkalibacillus halophilus TaxID=392827 RepID=UPI0004145129|nr:DUF1405 domain-containing protein [Halalkalibacillus halophilus]
MIFLLMDRRILVLLLLFNIFGTLYGFYWYQFQLEITPLIFIPFVPDSPTASMFFVFVLIGFLMNKHFKYMEALALLTLFKYGTWAVVMNVLTFIHGAPISLVAIMLIVSHGAMAIQALLYIPFYHIEFRHFAVAAIWTIHNDVIDYVYGMMPIYHTLDDFKDHIGYFTFWLSILSIWIVYYFGVQKPKTKTTLSSYNV